MSPRHALLAVLLVAAGCEEGRSRPAPSGALEGVIDGGGVDAGPGPIRFAEVRSRILMGCGPVSCHKFPGAHNAELAIHSSVPDADLHRSLVNAPSGVVMDRPTPNVGVRVVPFRPRESFLLWKLTGHDPDAAGPPVVGARMPLGGPRYLGPEDLAFLRSWIEQGARLD